MGGLKTTGRASIRRGSRRVTILGPGTITGCGAGVVAIRSSGLVVQGLTLTKNTTGMALTEGDALLQNNVIVSNWSIGVITNFTAGTTLRENYIAGNGDYGVACAYSGRTTFDRNIILGNRAGGIAQVGNSENWIATLSNDIVLGNGTWTDGFDLSLRDGDDLLSGTICRTSDPSGLCLHPLPPFPFVASANQPPTASFTTAPNGLTVTVTDTSTDGDGTIVAWAWDYGNGPTAQTSHTFSTEGTYAVKLTVTDNAGATASTTQNVTVSLPPPPPIIHVSDLNGTATTNKGGWQATVTVNVHTSSDVPVSSAAVTGAWSGGATGSGSCTTDTTGTCAVNTARMKGASPVTYTVQGVTHSTLVYDPSANHETIITITKP